MPQIDKTGDIPVVKAGLANEKIPTYSLKIAKKETDTETIVKGAQFKIIGENKEENIIYTTDDNGIIQIDNLYQYVEGKSITGVYTLQEIYPSEGYILNNEPLQFKAQKDATGNLKLQIINGKIRENINDIQINNVDDGNIVINITVDNDPVFTLTKVDEETGSPLEGVRFQITDMDGRPVKDAAGNLVGINELEKINLYSTGAYAWTKNEDETWQSENYNIDSSTSTLVSDEFIVTEKAELEFEWSVSSENINYDYMYYLITNLETNETIGGIDKKIGGTSYGNEYKSLKYNKINEILNPGKYKIEFTYSKDENKSSGLDRAFIKNVMLMSAEKGVKTDSKGKIRLSLKEGLYKAIETEPLEGYEKPDLYTGIGIGTSKSAIYDYKVENDSGDEYETFSDVTTVKDGIVAVSNRGIEKYDFDGNIVWENAEKSYDFYKGVTTVEDGVIAVLYGHVKKYDLNGNMVWDNAERSYNFYGVTTVENGVVAVTYNGIVIKYDLNGNIIWENTEKTYVYQRVAAVEDGVIAVGQNGKVVKYDLNGNIAWENTEKTDTYYGVIAVEDGIVTITGLGHVIKYDFNGSIVWEKSCYALAIEKVDNGFITVGTNGRVLKFDLNGNIVWENTEKSYSYYGVTNVGDGVIAVAFQGQVVKYDLNGTIKWENTEKSYNYLGTTTVEDGVISVSNNGQVAKHDYKGNIEWRNTEKLYNYKGVTAVEDGAVAVGYNGKVVKYDLNGNIVWENTEKIYAYQGVTTVEDGIIAVGQSGKVVKYDLNGNIAWENTEKSYMQG